MHASSQLVRLQNKHQVTDLHVLDGPVPVMLAILYTFIDYEHFADRVRQLYFATDTPSEASFITVNVGLTYIFFEASLMASDPAKKAIYDECRATSQNNLEIALAQLNMMMPATAENIEALVMGVSDPSHDRSAVEGVTSLGHCYYYQCILTLTDGIVHRPLSVLTSRAPRLHGFSCPELPTVRSPLSLATRNSSH